MNILLLTGLYDSKPASGGSYLMKYYVNELRKQGHRVFLYYFTSDDKDPRTAAAENDNWYLGDVRDNYYQNKSFAARLWRKLKNTLKPDSKSGDLVDWYFAQDFTWLAGALKPTLDNNNIDIVQVDFPWMMGVAEQLPQSMPKVFVSHEAQFVLFGRAGKQNEAERCTNFETTLANRYNAVLTLTDVEASRWQQLALKSSVYYSPMGLALPNLDNKIAASATKLVFVGSGNHSPNLDGISFFLNDIWPLVRLRYPDIQIAITGKYDEVFLAGLAHIEGVNWVGYVDSLADLMHGAISIIPIRLGSGIRVKILESMAMGAPVVSTPMAAEGINATDNEQICLAGDVDQFADTVCMLLGSPQKYTQMAYAARQFVRENFELEKTVANRISLLETIIASSGR